MTLNWAVIGCGGIADRRTIPEGIIPSSKCNLVAVMDSDPARAAAVAAKYGGIRHYIKTYAALQERSKASGFQTGVQPVQVEAVNPYRAEVEHFADCIEHGYEPINNGEHALHDLKLVLAAYEAAKTGRVVDV